jgi:multimeric flavodoxin WrbA
MNITVINGTEQHGCTYQIKEQFLGAIGSEHIVTEYYLPKDCPVFCTGCKACFYKDISVCPHAE